MKLPPQRSGFHISDILELNNDSKVNLHHNLDVAADSHNSHNIPAQPHYSIHPDSSNAYSHHAPQNPAYIEPAPAYHHIFPAMNRSWNYEGDNAHYGNFEKCKKLL
jgi:hypothetical protein